MDGEAWQADVHRVAQSWTPLKRFSMHIPVPVGSSVVKNPPANEGDTGDRRRGLDPWVWEIPWRRKKNSLQYSRLEKFHGQRSLEGYSPWGRKQLGMTERLSTYVPVPLVSLSLNPSLHHSYSCYLIS